MIVAELSGSIVGYAALSSYRPRAGYRFSAENSVYVDSDHWGKGYGSKLLGHLIERATAMGLRTIVAAVSSDNEVSIRFHRRHGFVESGRLPNLIFKFDRWIDVVYMTRDLH